MSVARVHKDACANRPSSYFDYESFEPKWREQKDEYEIIRKIGRGKYSEVCVVCVVCVCVCVVMRAMMCVCVDGYGSRCTVSSVF